MTDKSLQYGIQFKLIGEDKPITVWFDNKDNRNDEAIRLLLESHTDGFMHVGDYYFDRSGLVWYRPIEDTL